MIQDIRLYETIQHQRRKNLSLSQQPLWYESCDLYGIYVIDEANIESTAWDTGTHLAARRDYLQGTFCVWKECLKEIKPLLYHCLVHGNEAGDGDNFTKGYELLQSRYQKPIQYERATRAEISDIFCSHVYGIRKLYPIPGKTIPKDPDPMRICSCPRAIPRRIRSLLEIIRKYPNYQGLYLGFVDQALYLERPAVTFYFRCWGDYNRYDASIRILTVTACVQPRQAPTRMPWKWHTITRMCGCMTMRLPTEIRVFNEYFFRDLSTYPYHGKLADWHSCNKGSVNDLSVKRSRPAKVDLATVPAETCCLMSIKNCFERSFL